MTLRVIGAGLGRTGTHSLKIALDQLLGARCYHMMEVFGRPDDMPVWEAAANGDMPDWPAFFSEFEATVDWPAASFWRELTAAFPDAPVLLSTRASADVWWKSASNTIFNVIGDGAQNMDDAFTRMWHAIAEKRFSPGWQVEETAKAAYDAHNAAVRAAIPADRLFEYQPGDGWAPLCAMLDVPEPDEPFPHTNSTADFRKNMGWD